MSVQSDRLLEDWPVLGDDGGIKIHRFLTGSSRPKPGDVALCGWVKRTDIFRTSEAARASGLPMCRRCAELDRSFR